MDIIPLGVRRVLCHHREVVQEGRMAEGRVVAKVGLCQLTTLGQQAQRPISGMVERIGGLVGTALEAAL